MRGFVKFLAVAFGLLIVVVIGLVATGRAQTLLYAATMLGIGSPDRPFDATELTQSLDYSSDQYWAALPGSGSYTELVPEGIHDPEWPANHQVDVFFIHPTGLLNGDLWVSDLDPSSDAERSTMSMMANQASVFNGCCQIYAPRYREANIYAYVQARGIDFRRIMRFAYSDVQAAFKEFIAHRNQGRPFIIASHSQGTHHAMVLLREEIDGTPLVDRMIAAYLIGGRLSQAEMTGLEDITVCDSPTQLHCLVHWDTVSEKAEVGRERAGNICVNPLTWRRDEVEADRSEHDGAVLPFVPSQRGLSGGEQEEVEIHHLGAPVTNYLSARCGDGVLYVPDLAGSEWAKTDFRGGIYHVLDYSLFSIDIRNNAILRSETYFRNEAEGGDLSL